MYKHPTELAVKIARVCTYAPGPEATAKDKRKYAERVLTCAERVQTILDNPNATDEYARPYYCQTCRNTFATVQMLREHRKRKHAIGWTFDIYAGH